MKELKYTKDLPRQMYMFFTAEGSGAPSFAKFARSIGTTLATLEGFRRYKKFDEAYRECGEIRRDYLIDCALTKRHDSSFTKFILGCEFGMGEDDPREGCEPLKVTLEVLD